MPKAIKRIHEFGPEVGKWKSHGTVAETFARIRKEQERQRAQAAEAEMQCKVAPIARRVGK